jgi:response regulator of citrate/malate metabolism
MKEETDKMIMLIDDNEIDNYINRKFIEDKNITKNILVKTTIADAIKYFDPEMDDGRIPELILLDINLPALNGYDFLQRFYDLNLSHKKKSCIIILSSSDSDDDIMAMKSHPLVSDYFIKPLTPQALNIIENILK